ncbi:MAG: hypothetical protein V4568_09255 [Pseudomonadota bacterium]
MFTKRLLFLTNHRIVSVIWKRGVVLDCQVFPLTTDGRLGFSRHVAARRTLPAYVLTELVEEDFRNDVIPHVIQRDRRAILERKLAQIYRSTPYRLGIVQGRDPEGRRDDRVLYTAITNPDLVKSWVELLTELGSPLAGVYSAPLLSLELLKTLKVTNGHVLLTSLENGGGLRQTYFYRGEIKFSRLTPITEISSEELPLFIADEVSKTWQYLDSLRYFTRTDILDIFILAHPDDHAGINEAAPQISQLRYHVVNICDVATRAGLRETLPDSDATSIFIQLLGKQPPSEQFASHEETHGMRLWKTRMGLYAASVLILITTALWGGVNAYLTSDKDKEIQSMDLIARHAAQQHQAAINAQPPSEVSPAVMRDSVMLYDALVKNSPAPTQSIRTISQVLDRFPNIRIQQIIWGLTNDQNTILGYAPTTGSGNALLTSSKTETPTTPPPSVPADNGTTLGDTYQIAIIEADIYPFDGNYREALRNIDEFEKALKELPGVQVNVLSKPVDLTSNATLVGRPATTSIAPRAHFAVKLTIELPKT